MQEPSKSMTAAILSLSLLTVMAGAAVAPALDVIRCYFADADQMLIQLVISMPALFIMAANLLFPRLASRFGTRTLLLAGLALYVVGGCSAGLFNNIYAVLAMRALVGLGTGIIMPLSTGLLAFYYPRSMQDKLMGCSSAMNQMGGVMATLFSGLLAAVSWRASFLVYLMGLLAAIPCIAFLPNDRLTQEAHANAEGAAAAGTATSSTAEGKRALRAIGDYASYIVSMFLLMATFFVYPSSFAMETAAEGALPVQAVTYIMAGMDLVAFFGGLAFVRVKRRMGSATCFCAPVLFIAGYALLTVPGGWLGTLAGSACIGFANGVGIPFIIAAASAKAGRSAGATVLPYISMALYLAQFMTPLLLSAMRAVAGGVPHAPYLLAVITGCLLLALSAKLKGAERGGSE